MTLIFLVTRFLIRRKARRRTSRGYKLSLMRSCRPEKVATVILGFCFLCVACGHDTKPGAEDSAGTVAAPVSNNNPAFPVNTGWDESAAGEFMILSAADDGITAAVVMPNETDSSLAQKKSFPVDALSNSRVDLFNASGSAGTSSILPLTLSKPQMKAVLSGQQHDSSQSRRIPGLLGSRPGVPNRSKSTQ